MKRTIIILLALAALPLSAGAQARTVEDIADKYSGREGFSTTVIRGAIGAGMGDALNVHDIDISNIMDDISSIVIVTSEKRDKEFSADVKEVVAAGGYSTLMSVSADGELIKFLLRTLPGTDKDKKPAVNEFVIVILGAEDNMIMSIVGNYRVKKVGKTEP